MGSGLEGRLCMLRGWARGRGDIAGEGRVKMQTCILGPDVPEFVEPIPLAPDPKTELQPLCGTRYVCYDGGDKRN